MAKVASTLLGIVGSVVLAGSVLYHFNTRPQADNYSDYRELNREQGTHALETAIPALIGVAMLYGARALARNRREE